MNAGLKRELTDFIQEFRDLLVGHAGFLLAAMAGITAAFVAWEMLIS